MNGDTRFFSQVIDILLSVGGDGTLRPSAASTYVGPLQGNSFVMATSEAGTAVVVYQAGHNFTTVTVTVRPYSFDAGRSFYSFIEILQQ